jgi:ABC-type Fe3+-hydroxamate transport system substrate-binding protein
MHKDAYGFKGSWMEMPTTDAELRSQIEEMDKEIKSLGEEIDAQIKAEEAEAEYQRQLAGEHTAAVKEALKPSASFTIGDLFPA